MKHEEDSTLHIENPFVKVVTAEALCVKAVFFLNEKTLNAYLLILPEHSFIQQG